MTPRIPAHTFTYRGIEYTIDHTPKLLTLYILHSVNGREVYYESELLQMINQI